MVILKKKKKKKKKKKSTRPADDLCKNSTHPPRFPLASGRSVMHLKACLKQISRL